MTMQAGMTKVGELFFFSAVHRTLRDVFPVVRGYQAFISCYGTPWGFILASKGTDPAIVERLSKSLQVALKDPGVVERFAELGTAPASEADATPAALKAKLESEIERWRPVITAAGVYAD